MPEGWVVGGGVCGLGSAGSATCSWQSSEMRGVLRKLRDHEPLQRLAHRLHLLAGGLGCNSVALTAWW